MHVGFIGLGLQGAPMAERIARAGFPITVWARRQEVRAEWSSRGVSVTDSAAELGRKSDLVALCVTGDSDVTELVEGSLLNTMRPGSTIVVHSTIAADTISRLAKLTAQQDIAMLDAPVSGGPDAAASGNLLLMVGGDDAVHQRALPVLAAYGDPIIYLGPLGNGLRAKILNNLVFIVNLAVAEHATRLGEALGMDRADLKEVLLRGSGRSMACEVLERTVSEHAAHVAALFSKDLGLVDELASSTGVPSAEFLSVGDALCRRLIQASAR